MSRKHPQNGPSLGKAPYKKSKPLSDEELAAKQDKEKRSDEAMSARVEAAQRKVADGRRFNKAVKENGGTISIRGGSASQFWSKLRNEE
jgi:hypothetical protein